MTPKASPAAERLKKFQEAEDRGYGVQVEAVDRKPRNLEPLALNVGRDGRAASRDRSPTNRSNRSSPRQSPRNN